MKGGQVIVSDYYGAPFYFRMSPDLPDVQNGPDDRQIPLAKVGITRVVLPFQVDLGNRPQQVTAACSLSVDLPEDKKGTNMSRLMIHLQQWSLEGIGLDLKALLDEGRKSLDAQVAELELAFTYFLPKPSPVSDYSSLVGYEVCVQARLAGDDFRGSVEVVVPTSNCCPCSKAIAETGAHNQRSLITATLLFSEVESFDLGLLVKKLEQCGSCPVYPIIKRTDEKFVTERQYENPKFVEDVARDCVNLLRGYEEEGFLGYNVRVEAEESIHPHNAWCEHYETFS